MERVSSFPQVLPQRGVVQVEAFHFDRPLRKFSVLLRSLFRVCVNEEIPVLLKHSS